MNLEKLKNKIICMDCMDLMALMPDKYIDVAIVDTPYGIKQDGRNNHTRGKLAVSKDYSNKPKYDNNSPDKKYFDELLRVSKNQIIWGANHFISKIPYDSSCWIVWDKINGETDFADCELAWTSFNTAVRCFKFQWQGMIQGYGGNKRNNEIRIHPNQKPIALGRWLLQKYAKAGDLILDTHSGSGSFACSAWLENFEFYACEKEQDYWKDSVDRFETLISQGRLFL